MSDFDTEVAWWFCTPGADPDWLMGGGLWGRVKVCPPLTSELPTSEFQFELSTVSVLGLKGNS